MNKPSGFGDADTKRILERAAEIDAERPVDEKTLREIALEAGISRTSLDMALQEHQTPAPIEDPVPGLKEKLWEHRIALAFLVALVIAFLMRLTP